METEQSREPIEPAGGSEAGLMKMLGREIKKDLTFSNWICVSAITEMVKLGNNRCEGENYEFPVSHTEFEMPISHPGEDIK